MFNFDVEIERISNGYIVTNSQDNVKRFYPSLVEFYQCIFDDRMKEKDIYYREHDADGEKITFKASMV